MTMPTTNEIRTMIDRGERTAARQQLMQLARAGGASTAGEIWWLLAQTLDDPAQRADCLARAQAASYAPPPVAPPPTAPAEEPPVFAWEQPVPTPAPGRSSSEPARPAGPAPLKPAKARRTARQDRAAAAAPPRYPPEQIEFVISEFGKHENRYEITQKAMGYYDLTYDDAQKLIDYVEHAHSKTIARKQLPLILVLSIAGMIGGSYLLFRMFGSLPMERVLISLVSPRVLVRVGAALSAIGSGVVGLIYGIMALRGKR
jgi:hypothetical protein